MANGLSAGCCCGCAECIGYQVSFLYDWHDLVDASFTHDGTQVRIALLFDTSGQTGFGVSFKGAPRLQGTRITNAAGTEVGSIGRLYASALLPSSNAEFDTWFAGAVTPLDSQPDGIPTAPIDGVLWMFRYNSSTPINDFNRNLYLGSKFNFFRSSNSGDRAALNSYPDWRTLFVRESEGVYRTLTPLPRMELEVSLNDFPATPVDDVSAGIEIFHVDDADVEHQLFQRTVTSRLVTDSIQYRAVGSPNQQLDALTSGRVIEVDGTGGYGILAFQPAGVGAQWQYYGVLGAPARQLSTLISSVSNLGECRPLVCSLLTSIQHGRFPRFYTARPTHGQFTSVRWGDVFACEPDQHEQAALRL